MSIVLREISKSYGATIVLRGVSLRVDPGSPICIQGKNGSGKTTLLKIMALIAAADAGSVIINGMDLANVTASVRERVRIELMGYSFQEPLLIPYLTALENLLVATAFSPSPNSSKSKAIRLLSDVGLSSRTDHLPSKLSVGEKKRVDLARAILRRPKILIADEPLSNLDPDSAELVVGLLDNYNEEGEFVICSASDPAHAKWAPNVTVL